jgi:diguanylate cyclase (GGDEF)-like protein
MLDQSKRSPEKLFAVLFLDFDRFKIINDSLGHAIGDKLLISAARRLEAVLRPGDLIARLGGDEFTILLSEFEDQNDALHVADRIHEELKNPFNINGHEISTSVSIGIALSSSEHEKAEDMLRGADIAMYRAKTKGPARYQVFDRSMHKQALTRLQLETEMPRAFDQQEFCLYYQPIINLHNSEIVGFESLIRWQHPTRGLIPPTEFIPMAEESGFILSLGQWILRESCRQLRQWQATNLLSDRLTISVNLSGKQFLQFDLAERIDTILKETSLPPHCLRLEITESHLMENTEMAVTTLNKLRSLGLELSLDDFGTGYSSLSYLHRLPVSHLKIDQSFVHQMIKSTENSEIVQTIVKLAHNLKMSVVAEGIETAEQLAYLKKLNCDFGQGFLYSYPLDAICAAEIMHKPLTTIAQISDQQFVSAN